MLEQHEHGDVHELRLARPPANALDTELLNRLSMAIEGAVAEGVRALVLSGSRGLFSGGLDVPALLELDRPGMAEFWQSFFEAQRQLAQCPVPVVAAITGHSPAGGAVLALYCDYRLMAEGDFKIGLNEVAVGLNPGPILHRLLVRAVGQRQAELLMVNGAMLRSEEALRTGLVDRLEAVDDVVPAAVGYAEGMLDLPPNAMSSTRAIARADLIDIVSGDTDAIVEMMNDAWFHPETQATLTALVTRLRSRKSS